MKDLKIDDGLLSTDIKKLRKRVAAMAVKRDRSMLHSLMSHVNKLMNKAFRWSEANGKIDREAS